MQVLQVKKYNELEGNRFDGAMRQFLAGNYLYCPTPDQFGFWNHKTGQLRKTGYVAFTIRRAFWAKTKSEAIGKFKK